jgi:HD-GYP domain-containing protein (c-di-GMP phosphodiesterase class II)
LRGEDIPIEARIVAVADVFDALTSARPYKEAWSNDDAYAALETLSGNKLDPACVQALVGNRAAVEQIQKRFRESDATD